MTVYQVTFAIVYLYISVLQLSVRNVVIPAIARLSTAQRTVTLIIIVITQIQKKKKKFKNLCFYIIF